jgi:hypothetical protein
MKLAEALVLRADVMKRLAQVRARLMRNAKVQEGDEPAERPEELLAEYERLAHQLRELIGAINRTNCAIVFDAGTLTDALAIRDVLRLRQATYRDLAEEATVTQMIGTRSEVRFRPAVSVSDIQKAADALAQDLRRLDTRIQEANWTSDLIG